MRSMFRSLVTVVACAAAWAAWAEDVHRQTAAEAIVVEPGGSFVV